MFRSLAVLGMTVMTAFLGNAAAQSAVPAVQDDRGITSYMEFGGSSDSDGQLYELNSNVGYDFTRHFGMAVGVPIYFVRPSSSTSGTSTNGVGNPYLTFHLKYPGSTLGFASALTGAAPVGDSKKGLSTGHATYDWTNRLEHGFSQLTPFAEVGIGNSIMDSRLFLRPYTTFGFNTHFRIGADYDVWKFVSVGASGYDIVPSGQQTIFSRVTPAQANTGVQHGRVFQTNQQVTGSASLAHDDGFSTWIDANPGGKIDLELGFTRSFPYDLNSVSFSIGVNLAKLYGRNQK